MYNAGGRIKLLAVDGVSASSETIADGSYPCVGYNYAIFDANEPQDSDVRLLVEWLLTSAGQRVMASAGYVPLNGSTAVEANALVLYDKTGTGGVLKKASSYYYTCDLLLEAAGEDILVDTDEYNFDGTYRHVAKGVLPFVDEINSFVDEIAKKFTELRLNTDTSWQTGGPKNVTIHTEFAVVNDYISVGVYRSGYGMNGAIWRISTGERLELSDLFADGVEFVPVLNEAVRKWSEGSNGFEANTEHLRPFAGLTADFDDFALTSVNNTYPGSLGADAVCLTLSFNMGENSYFMPTSYSLAMVCVSPLSLDGCLLRELCEPDIKGVIPYIAHFGHDGDYWHEKQLGEAPDDWFADGVTYTLGALRMKTIAGYASADAINDTRLKLMSGYDIYEIDKACTPEALDTMSELYEANYGIPKGSLTRDELKACYVTLYSETLYYRDDYVFVRNYASASYGDAIGYGGGIEYGAIVRLYDLTTGEELPFDSQFSRDWYNTSEWYSSNPTFYGSDVQKCQPPTDAQLLTSPTLVDIAPVSSGRTDGASMYIKIVFSDGASLWAAVK